MDENLLDRFFAQARAVSFGEQDRIELTADELSQLVSNEMLRLRFRTRFQREVQDPDLRALILIYFRGLASKEEEFATEAKIDADGIDIYIGRVGVGASGAGVAAIASTGGIGAFILLAGGLVGLAVSGITSHALRRKGLKRSLLARRVRELLEELGNE